MIYQALIAGLLSCAANAAVYNKNAVRGADPYFVEDWSQGIDFSIWKHEITMGGGMYYHLLLSIYTLRNSITYIYVNSGGNWEFEYYVNNRTNSYVENGVLYILPTETADRFGADAVSGSKPTTIDIWGNQPAGIVHITLLLSTA
jgi:hypothetical protein